MRLVKFTKAPRVAGPSSSLGIMRFFDADTAGPKISPEMAVGFAVAFIVIILGLKLVLPF